MASEQIRVTVTEVRQDAKVLVRPVNVRSLDDP